MSFSLFSSSNSEESSNSVKLTKPVSQIELNKGKNIVLCFDGTKENFGPQPFTNVLKIYQILENSADQICYYQPGIGTGNNFDAFDDIRRNFTFSTFKNLFDSMFATGVNHHIKKAYRFLMKYYRKGDKIYMIGFSRGAFFARVLAGMIQRVGLLHDGLDDLVDMAWGIYEFWEYAEQPTHQSYTTTLVEEFRKLFSRDYIIKIHFQGLFDSVNSVGILRDRLFPCTQRSSIVDHVRHAVSIDERRGKFKQQSFTPNPYSPAFFSLKYKSFLLDIKQKNSIKKNDLEDSSRSKGYCNGIENPLISHTLKQRKFNVKNQRVDKCCSEQQSLETADLIKKVDKFLESSNPKTPRSIECSNRGVQGEFNHNQREENNITPQSFLTSDLVEKWFPGDHSDIGGSWPDDCFTHQNIANVSLRWMLAESLKHGLIFKKGSLKEFDQLHPLIPSFNSRRHDALNFQGVKQDIQLNLETQRSIPWRLSIATFKRLSTKFNTTELIKKNKRTIKQKFKNACQPLNKFQIFFWWILEWIPIGLRVENVQGKWCTTYVPNLGRNRYMPIYADLHWSVFWRIKFDKEYKPKNLPKYARDLIEEFEGVKLQEQLIQIETPIVSGYKSFPREQLNRTSSLESLGSSTSEPGSAYSFLLSRMMYEGMTDILYFETRKHLQYWEDTKWRFIPDELSEILSKRPDI
ncbi:hypothetical protein TBLA_0C01620 [Henningerozyma blattae CBS 6284]|uniref:T6SS Phospholipase effector Tle1-like catalytic domain-containing protein n=1 Tax=Henningerozyma blattae (strain ATCC 34711 / CBS 6284 / DSM 70876 / NBRC 10599 / NRRL Y-10934 / UCD 77-7) TaxID=1071380 RepID=I2H0S4_HENB6|nr:hypothetical protein TBLA_0C01620 [Tetrapisispora blattae CBS 6284]CCH59976.1 hypothetical protein TBLA_0C01620 [Tetrapisispora blattae CBS 6284]